MNLLFLLSVLIKFLSKLLCLPHHRSLWVICGILLYFSEVDVCSESGPVRASVWPGGAARGITFLYMFASVSLV